MTKLLTDQIGDVNGSINLLDQGVIDLEDALASDGDYCGITSRVTVDTNSTGFGSALVLSSDGNYDEADADAESTMPCSALAIDTGTGSNQRVLHLGYIRDDDWDWTPGGILYISTTAGGLAQTAPSGTGDQVQVVGIAKTADIVFFNPSFVLIEVV